LPSLLSTLGTGVLVFALYLFLREKDKVIVNNLGEIVDLQVSFGGVGGRLKSRSSAAVVLLAGMALLLVPPVLPRYFGPELSITGKIMLHEGKNVTPLANAVVGVVPMGSHAAITLANGTYRMAIPKGREAEQYQVFAHYSNPNPAQALFTLGVVHFDAAGKGSFDYIFTRSTR
jgi:hypothetical protein